MSVQVPPSGWPDAIDRWMRQLHPWIGVWGALAPILSRVTGLVMNHRFGDQAWRTAGSKSPTDAS